MKTLQPEDWDAIRYVAGTLGVPVEWLTAVINFETAGTWDPAIKNKAGSSGRGLIQFIDSTARVLGYENSLDLVSKHPTVRSQLYGPILKYFQQWKGVPRDKQDFYLRVFFPSLRNAPPDTVIYADDAAKRAKFRAQNPGIETVGDYVRKLERHFSKYRPPAKTGGSIVVALAIVGLFLGRFFK